MKTIKRHICSLLAGILFIGCLPLWNSATTAIDEPTVGQTDIASAQSYSEYIAQYASAAKPEQTIRIEAVNFKEASQGVSKENNYIVTSDESTVTFEVTVAEAGLYQMAFVFQTKKDYGSMIERGLFIDGKLPFQEANILSFSRLWKDTILEDGFEVDGNGDQLRPSAEEVFEQQTQFAMDSSGYEPNAFFFYFSAGIHTITLTAVRESMLLEALLLTQQPSILAYRDVVKEKPVGPQADPIKIEAETPDRKSHTSVHVVNDNTSPITSPQSSSRRMMNILGGENWKTVGQWVEWDFKVETEGWYQIDCRYLQNVNVGLYSSREITIDGELPYQETAAISFLYGREWQQQSIGDENGAFAFYLTAGKHTLRMRAVLGDMAEVLRQIEECVGELNTIYREILFVTGATADPYRTYRFPETIPDTILKIQAAEKEVTALTDALREISGRSNTYTGLMDRLAFQLKQMGEDPEANIASNFSTFKTNIGSLSSNLATMRQQPLALDYILVQPYGTEAPKAEASIFSRFSFSFSQFIWSFFRDYSIVSDTAGEGESVIVWSSTGRDQTEILRQMIMSDFTPRENISVTLQLVPAATLLPAVLAGSGPDVALFNDSGRPVEFAVRGAVTDISKMPDYVEVVKRFLPTAVIPFSVGDSVYALPETQTIPMLFYRADLLAELELSVPKTWDDLYDMLPVLQRNGMNFGFGMDMTGVCTFLYQMGGDLYNEEGTRILLDTNEGLSAFKKTCDLYTKYKLPPTFSFVDRFRSGEMPMAIADYSTYTQLAISAPELDGLWEMAPIPGILQEDGSINHTAPTGGSAVMMLSASKNPTGAWEFMKWWTEADVQNEFSNELSILLGEETFFASANNEAFMMQQWSTKHRAAILEQREQLRAIPNVPGGYYTSRYIGFALTNVYNKGEKPTEAILGYIEEINDELIRKREELNLLS